MVSNKKRLYVALYPSGVVNNEERKYHWGFLVGPKNEKPLQVPGARYHVKNLPLLGWTYEEKPLGNVKSTVNLLVRIAVAKIEDESELKRILRGAPVINNDPNWRCRSWVADVLGRLAANDKAVGTADLDWGKIEPLARNYVARKNAEGRYSRSEDLLEPKPTWDMMEGKETVD